MNQAAKNIDFLKKEYFHLQNTVETFDQKALTIKAWSVTFSMVAVGTAYSKSEPIILILASIASFLFWIIEARWKRFQHAHFERIKQIEGYFSDESDSLSPLQISKSWNTTYHDGKPGRYKFLLFQHIYLPHAPVCIGSFLLYIFESIK